MATIGGLSTSTSSSIRGYGGLASGLDRDTLIENLTYGTTSKITQQQQKKTTLEWKQAAVRNISDKMISFANKYTATMASKTNLFSSVFWGRSNITLSGANSKFVKVTGTANSAASFAIAGVKQLAQKAKWTSSASVSDRTLNTGAIDTTKTTDVQNLVGKSIDFEYGGQRISIDLKAMEGYDYKNADDIAAALNKLFEDETVKTDKNTTSELSKVIKATAKDGVITFENIDPNKNDLKLVGGDALKILGIDAGEDGLTISAATDADKVQSKALEEKDLITKTSFEDTIGGKTITFNYNGKSATVKLPGAEELTKNEDGTPKTSEETREAIRKSIQEQLDTTFGEDRIEVAINAEGGLALRTTNPAIAKKDDDGNVITDDKGNTVLADDTSSTLSVAYGDSGVLEALNVKEGESNRLNIRTGIAEAGAKGGITFEKDADGKEIAKTITINGKDFNITSDTTLEELMGQINDDPDARVKISYESNTDKFTISSTVNGASGKVDISGDQEILKMLGVAKPEAGKENGVTEDASGNLSLSTHGQDAIIAVKYGDSDEAVELVRDSNSFTMDGMAVTVSGEFGYVDNAGVKELDKTSEDVTFTANVDADSIVETIKTMVEEYNAIIDLVNTEMTTKPDRDYSPLTSEQKSELTEDEVKTWEEKAKEGLLYGDADLRNLSNDLRFVIGGSNFQALSDIGLTTSTSWTDNGKLVLDEAKLRSALESDPESVEKAFTDSTGLGSNLKDVMNKYVKTIGTKGILIEKAGSKSSPLSITNNTIYKQIDDINKQIAKLQARLKTEQDRYISQFTSLESLISQMNSQSGWLSSFGSY